MTTLRIDLHAHSAISDGTDAPATLVAKAVAAGLDVLALTDHDTTAGWAEATAAADDAGLRLIRGIEISTSNDGRGQHLLAYEPDPGHPRLTGLLARGVTSREQRIPAMVDRIRDTGIEGLTVALVQEIAGAGSIGRPHIADALVGLGAVTDRQEAFVRYLRPECPTYVPRWTPDIVQAIQAVTAAGGVSVVAHPWGRKTHVTEERFAALAAAGLSGIEVDHQEHDPAARDALRGIARNLGLVVTGSSDHHGTGKVDHDLGCNTTHPDEFDRLLDPNRSAA